MDEGPDNDPAMLGMRTVSLIQKAIEAKKATNLAQIIDLIREVSGKFETIPVQSLGEVVGRELHTMSRVISMAHSIGYNPEGIEISNINEAIHVIGFNKIRNLAISLMLAQRASKDNQNESRVAAARALTEALLAQALRARQGRADSEEAFVCAALRNYGHLMLASLLPTEYRQALTESCRRGDMNAVFRKRFGHTPRELSVALLKLCRMPRNVMQSLREVSEVERMQEGLPPENELPVVAGFAEELCRLVDTPFKDAGKFTARAMEIIQSYGVHVSLTEDELFEIMGEVTDSLRVFGAMEKGNVLSCPLLRRLETLAARENPEESATPVSNAGSRLDEDGDTDLDAGPTSGARDPLAVGIATLMELAGDHNAPREAAHDCALRAIHEGLALDQTLVFVRDGMSGKYLAWRGMGDFINMLRGELLLDVAVRDVFSVCLKRGEDVLIQNPADPKIQAFIPDWLKPAAGGQPMILLPVRDAHGTVAVFCGLRADSSKFVVSSRQTQQLRALRQRLAEIEMRLGQKPQTADAPSVG